jgi:hypothetical protein
MGLYERLLEERAEDEQQRGETPPPMRILNSRALGRWLEDGS